MSRITATDLPKDALLQRYASLPGHYTDCFAVTGRRDVTLADFVATFYTTPLFRAERVVLRVTARRPSTDAEARAVANGQATHFAAWTVEDRTTTQLLMCDISGRTRSWFQVAPGKGTTTLLFGSAVTPPAHAAPDAGLGASFRLLLPAHRVYARALLAAAARRLR